MCKEVRLQNVGIGEPVMPYEVKERQPKIFLLLARAQRPIRDTLQSPLSTSVTLDSTQCPDPRACGSSCILHSQLLNRVQTCAEIVGTKSEMPAERLETSANTDEAAFQRTGFPRRHSMIRRYPQVFLATFR